MHDNANITCAISETNIMLQTALSLQPQSGGDGEKSWDVTIDEKGLFRHLVGFQSGQFTLKFGLLGVALGF